MRNIIALIQRFYVFLIFLGLQVFALYILFDNNNFHNSQFLNQSSNLVGGVYSQRARLSEYLRLGEINDQLSLDNARLRSQRAENFYVLRTAVDTVRDTSAIPRYTYRSAKVVNYTTNREKNYVYLTLDRGTLGDIRPNMGVIAQGAIVGKVVSVSEHFAVIMPILHRDFITEVRHKKSGFTGNLVWKGGDPSIANVIDITRSVPIIPGDTVITTGRSNFFPANLMVGIVESVEEDKDYHKLRVRLAADFRKIDYVEVISDFLHDERQNLEQQVDNANNNPQ